MATFTMIRTYTCRAATGYVYEINGKRAASLAKSLDALKTSLGVVTMDEHKHGDKVATTRTIAEMAEMSGFTADEVLDLCADLCRTWMGKAEAMRKIVAMTETVQWGKVSNAPGARAIIVTVRLAAVLANGTTIEMGPCGLWQRDFKWIAENM